MPGRIHQLLSQLLERGTFSIGQIRVHPELVLHHIEDTAEDDSLETYTSAEAVRRLVLYDDAGKYRPLKTAPNLRRGWRLRLSTVDELRLALDGFYPAAVGLWCACQAGELRPVPWRETVERQTGMYRVVGLITEEQTLELIASKCRKGCLRRILWPYSASQKHPDTVDPTSLPSPLERGEIPLLCAEACNLVVAAGRPIVKAAQKAAAEAQAAQEAKVAEEAGSTSGRHGA